MSFASMLKTNHTLLSVDLRGNGIIDQARTQKVVETDSFARAVLKATIYNPQACIRKVIGANLGRNADSCSYPRGQFNQHSTNEEVLSFAHNMEI